MSTLHEALLHVQNHHHPSFDLNTDTHGIPIDPLTRELVDWWATNMLEGDHLPSPAEVAARSGGLIPSPHVAALYNTSSTGPPPATSTTRWDDQGRREHHPIRTPGLNTQDIHVSRAIELGQQPILGMDDQFYWRDPAAPLYRVAPMFAGPDGDIHPAIRAAPTTSPPASPRERP